jgi:aminopeptidase YwaD
MKDDLLKKCKSCLDVLCLQISDRSVGSEGNRQATHFINNEFSSLGWTTEMPSFDAIDWIEKGAILRCGEQNFNVLVSPYSIGFRGEGQLVSASDISQLG